MATNGHERRPSSPTSSSNLPRPASRASATREAWTLRESLHIVADRNRIAAQGSPSPAPRPFRHIPSTSENRPLAHLFPDRPVELGRNASKRPRRDGPLVAKTSLGSVPHNDGDTDDELDRKMKKFAADDRVFEKLLSEEKNGPFAQRKIVGSSIGRPMSARGGAMRPSNGSHDGPLEVFAETGYGRQHTDMFRSLQQLERDPEAVVNHYKFLTGTDSGGKRKFASHLAGGDMPEPPVRPATSAPSMGGSSWEVEEDFSGDLQGSTSPPVSFGRPNTRIDELRQREIDAERQFPSPNKPLFLQRKNTKLGELARLEKEVLLKFPLDKDDESLSSPISDLPTIEEHPDGEGGRLSATVPFSRLDEVRDRASKERLARERHARDRLSSASDTQRKTHVEVPYVPARSVLRDFPQSKDVFQGGNGLSGISRLKSGDVEEQRVSKVDISSLSQQEPTPPKEDSHDLLRRLARASSKSPSPRSSQDEATTRLQQKPNAEVEPVPETKVASEYKFLSRSKPSVAFTGVSRSNSQNSISSKASAMSAGATSRIEAEAKLFSLDNNSERGSLRAPSPVAETKVEAGKETTDDRDETPRPRKFVDTLPAPTPVVTGAFIETPAPVRLATDVKDEIDILPERATTKTRDPSTFPRASKSDDEREYGRQQSISDQTRSKSTSRHRASPVKNTAKPPSVKEDLRQIYQRNNMDDSEADDLTGLALAAEQAEEVVRNLKAKVENDIKDMPDDERMKGMSDTLKTGLAQIRHAKRGIERLEGQVSRTRNASQNQHTDPAQGNIPRVRGHDSDNFMYIKVPVPKLYKKTPKLRPTLFGILALLLCFWQLYWFVEGIFYNQWGKPTVCYRGEICRPYNMDDPEYGYVIPVKLDEWITGGAIRPLAARWLEEAQDGLADFEDWVTSTDIRHVYHQAIRDPAEKLQYWRRIEKKGLFPEWHPAPWLRPEIEEWDRQARATSGYVVDDYDVDDDYHDPFNDSMEEYRAIAGDETVGGMW